MEAQEQGQLDLEARAQATDFEDWCLQLMGRRCYDTFIRPYTEKQWARPGPRAARHVCSPARAGPLRRRQAPVQGPLPGLARPSRRLHRADRGAARSPRHLAADGGGRRPRADGGVEGGLRRLRRHRPAGRVLREPLGSLDWRGISSQRSTSRTSIRAGRWSSTTRAPITPSSASTRPSTRPARDARDRARLRVHGAPTRYYPIEPRRTGKAQRATSTFLGPHWRRRHVISRAGLAELPYYRHGRLHAQRPGQVGAGAGDAQRPPGRGTTLGRVS